jgi:peptide-methionine (S)-S-oxide reductase
MSPRSNTLALAAAALFAVPSPRPVPAEEIAIFAGGCFWGVEAVFEHVRGVRSVESGYAGGQVVRPTYEAVSAGATGHAEAVRIFFDPGIVSYEQLLRVFFTVAHNPTERNRQGPDVGTQYRSVVFVTGAVQRATVVKMIDSLNAMPAFRGSIATEVVPATRFYPAESYHQDYLANHPDEPYIVTFDAPKLVALAKQFPDLYVRSAPPGKRRV